MSHTTRPIARCAPLSFRGFHLEVFETQIDDQTGLAMADAIMHNTTLQSFELDATLQSFLLEVLETQIDNQTGLAMCALAKNHHDV